MIDVYTERQALEEVLSDIPLKDWRDYDGDWLLEFFLRLRYPRKVARIVRRVCLALRGARPKSDDPEYQNIIARFIVAGPRGGGKCLAPETEVLMFDGSKRAARDVMPGDCLMGPDSRPRRVLNTTTGYGPLYRVTPTKGDPYVVNDAHVLSLKVSGADGVPKAIRNAGRHGDVVNMPVGDYARLSRQHRSHLPGWRTGVEFPERPLPLPPYFLGLWLGDGDALNPAVTTADQETVAYLAGFADASGLVLKCTGMKGNAGRYLLRQRAMPGGYNFHGKGGNVVQDALRMLGVMQVRGEANDKKHLPALYKANSRQARLELLAGLIDSDGYLHHGGYDYISKHERLADDVIDLCRSLGFAAYKHPCTKGIRSTGFSGTYYRVSISGDLSCVPVLIPRKKAAPRRQIKNPLHVGLTVEPVGDGHYCGFQVDGDHLFLLGDYTVTHNSMGDAAIEFVAWVFIDADVVNVGGSETQAQNVYAYLQGFLRQYSEEIERWSLGGRALTVDTKKETMSKTIRRIDPLRLHIPFLVGEDGQPIDTVGVPLAKDTEAFIAVCAASQKQVRGPHAGSQIRAGLLVVDEEGEVDADIFNAAKYMINTATPAVMLRTSTYHTAVGTFAEDFEDPDLRGFERHRYSIFDIAKTCPWAKTTPEQWALLEAGKARAPGDDFRGLLHLPVLQPDCTDCPRPEYFRDRRFQLDGKTGEMKQVGSPWCGGAAAFATNGWIDWESDGGLLQQFRDRANDEEFEVELCGLRPSTLGYVIKDRDSLKACFVDDELCDYLPPYNDDGTFNEGAGECIGTIDWGLKGMCAVTVLQNRTDLNRPFGCRVAIVVEDLGMQSEGVVYAFMESMRDQYGVQEVWADSSHPYNNLALRERGFHVEEVQFAQDKETGAGSMNAHVENGALLIPREMGKIAMKQLLGWRRDKMGKIVKGNDHFCDSLLCGLLRYLHLVAPRVSDRLGQSSQARDVNRQAQAPTVRTAGRGQTPLPVSELPGAARAVGQSVRHYAPPHSERLTPGGHVPVSRPSSLLGGPAARDVSISVPAPAPPASPTGETPTQRVMREAREKADRR